MLNIDIIPVKRLKKLSFSKIGLQKIIKANNTDSSKNDILIIPNIFFLFITFISFIETAHAIVRVQNISKNLNCIPSKIFTLKMASINIIQDIPRVLSEVINNAFFNLSIFIIILLIRILYHLLKKIQIY